MVVFGIDNVIDNEIAKQVHVSFYKFIYVDEFACFEYLFLTLFGQLLSIYLQNFQ